MPLLFCSPCRARFLCQSTGCLVINNYSVILYNSLGLYGSLPLLLYALYLLWATFMNFVSALIVDRLGRIRSLAIGFVSFPSLPVSRRAHRPSGL